jgi:hypothetical protein
MTGQAADGWQDFETSFPVPTWQRDASRKWWQIWRPEFIRGERLIVGLKVRVESASPASILLCNFRCSAEG